MSSGMRSIGAVLSIAVAFTVFFALTGCEQSPPEKLAAVVTAEVGETLPAQPAVPTKPVLEPRPLPALTPETEPAPAVAETTPETDVKVEETPRRPERRVADRYSPDADEWVVDELDEEKLVWGIETWGNPAQLSVSEAADGKRLHVKLEAGDKDKAAIRRPLRLDGASRGKVVLDVTNHTDEVVGLAIAIIAAEWYETPIQQIRPGANRNVSFDLKADNFKSESAAWKHTATIQQLENASWLYLLVYTREAGEFQFGNVRFLKAP